MSTRSATLVVFFLCATALVLLLLIDAFHQAPAAGRETTAAAGQSAGAVPAKPACCGGAHAAGAHPGPADPGLVPAPPSSDTVDVAVPAPPDDGLLDPPLTDAEKASGVTLIPGGGRVDFKAKTLSLPAEVCLRSGPIELFACAEGGKDHESVLRVRCRPELVNLNLILFSLKRGPSRPDAGGAAGDRILIFCEWEQDGKPVSTRAEDLIWDLATNRSMDRVGWTYTGSKFVPETDVETGKATGRSALAVVHSRTLIATFADASALFETPLPEIVDDTTFKVNEKVVPPRGTPVRLVFRSPTAEELAEIRKAEAEISDDRKRRTPRGRRREEVGPGDQPAGEKKEEKGTADEKK